MRGERYSEVAWDRDLKAGIEDDLRIIVAFLEPLSIHEREQGPKDFSFDEIKTILSQWHTSESQRQRFETIVKNYLAVHSELLGNKMTIRELLKLIRLELVSVKSDVSKPQETVDESLEKERIVADAYLSILHDLCGHDPSQKRIDLTVHQLDVLHEELISRSSQEKARLERTRLRNRRLNTALKDMEQSEFDSTQEHGERSIQSDETDGFADAVKLMKKKGWTDILKTEKRGSGIAQFVKQAEILVFGGRTFLFPKEEFYALSAEEQKRFINAFEKDTSFVVMEDVGRARYASEPVKNFVDVLLENNNYTEEELKQLLKKLDQTHGITQLAVEYQDGLLTIERFHGCDLINPRLFQVYFHETVKELEGVFTPEQIRQKLEEIRLQQITDRLIDLRFDKDEADQVIAQGIEYVLSPDTSELLRQVKTVRKFELVGVAKTQFGKRKDKAPMPGDTQIELSDHSFAYVFKGSFSYKTDRETVRVKNSQIFLVNGIEYSVYGVIQDPESEHDTKVVGYRKQGEQYPVFSLEELDRGLLRYARKAQEKYSVEESVQTAGEKFLKINDQVNDPAVLFVFHTAEIVKQNQFHKTKEVPVEVLFESVRCALLKHIGSQLVGQTSRLGERDIAGVTTRLVNLVNNFFANPVTPGENLQRAQRFVEINRRVKKSDQKYANLPPASMEMQKTVSSFFGRIEAFKKSVEGKGFEELEQLARLYTALIEAQPHVTISGFGVREVDDNASDVKTNALCGTIEVV